MKQQKILFIGGPGTGKSTLLHFLEQNGHCCFHEISREITLAAQKKGIDQLFLTEPLLFSELLLEGRIEQFRAVENSTEKRVFIDRGIPDVTAYLDYTNLDYPDFFREANKKYRYDKIFIFPIWKEIYNSDNERYETYEEALQIQNHLVAAYENLGYKLIQIPKATVEKRAEFILKQLDN